MVNGCLGVNCLEPSLPWSLCKVGNKGLSSHINSSHYVRDVRMAVTSSGVWELNRQEPPPHDHFGRLKGTGCQHHTYVTVHTLCKGCRVGIEGW